MFVTGVPPRIVPNITVAITEVSSRHIAITLSWREPFNNFDPIVNYIVSCSGDYSCPQSFNTKDNSTQNYAYRGLNVMTTYTFSVVATNSFGSGEAGVLMITTPGEITLHEYICSYYYYLYLHT